MITATFRKQNNSIVEYEIKGHANYAEKGKDIVCAAVSTLFTTITNEIGKLTTYTDNVEELDNHHKITLDRHNDEIDILTALLLNGMKSIAEEYPDYVEIIED